MRRIYVLADGKIYASINIQRTVCVIWPLIFQKRVIIVNNRKEMNRSKAISFATGTLYIERRRKLVRKPKTIIKL
jgi:hypothetical protein